MLRSLFCLLLCCVFSTAMAGQETSKASKKVLKVAKNSPKSQTSADAKSDKSDKTEKTETATAEANPEAKKNLEASQAFLEKNKNHPGVTTLPSGLQYKVHNEGNGQSPDAADFVTVHYRGTLIDGTEFDSSYQHNAPATFAVNAVIPGWTEALQLMKPGAKWTLYIPPKLAYGSRGAGKKIGPNAALIFDIELLKVRPSLDENKSANVDDWEDSD